MTSKQTVDRYLRETEIVLQQSHLRARKVDAGVAPVKRTEALAGLLAGIVRDSNMPESHYHGVAHWHRVFAMGIRLAEEEAYANKHDPVDLAFTSSVVVLFSLFHDSRREDEDEDPYHGPRAALRVEEMKTPLREFFHDSVIEAVVVACKLHTALQHPAAQHRFITQEFTGDESCVSYEIQTHAVGLCLDADRLDLPRVGITPHPRFLFTETAIAFAQGLDPFPG